MKNLFKRLPAKLMISIVTAMVAFVGLSVVSVALIGGDRQVKEYQGPGTPGFDHVTFNSFTNVPDVGDERNFFHGKIAGAPDGFYDPMNGVRDGDEILMRVYVHNGADKKHNESGQGIARNTKVRVDLPDGIEQSQVAHAYVSADNATPQVVEDTLTMNGEYPVGVKYVPGSATIKSNFIDQPLSDDIVNGGVLIGDDNVNGDMKGCFEYIALVTFKVKIESPRYTIEKQVSKADDESGSWQKSMEAKPGDEVSWMITFQNTGSTRLEDVKIVDEVPEGVEVVPGTVKLINGNYPDGYVYPDSAIQADGRQVNVDIGHYDPDGIAYVGFRTKVTKPGEDEKCGVKEIVNKAFATPKGFGAIWEKANIKVDVKCKPDKPVYSCDLLELTQLGGRQVEANVQYTAENGAQFQNVEFDFGDGSTPLVTDQTTVQHTYSEDGTYTVQATVSFEVDGETRTHTSEACKAPVTFKDDKPVPPAKPEAEIRPTALPVTGVGSIAAMFTATSIGGAMAYRVFLVRRFRDDQ